MKVVHMRCHSLATIVMMSGLVGCTAPHYRDAADAEPLVVSDASDADMSDIDASAEDAGAGEASLASDGAAEASLALDADTELDAADTGMAVPPEPHPDTWAGPLLGSYAVRIDSFTKDDPGGAINQIKEIALVQIERIGAEVWLSAQTCSWDGVATLGTTLLPAPAAVPPRRERVRYGDGHWRTESQLQPVGYTVQVPPECNGKEGLRVAKQPGQVWLADTCTCPSPNVPVPGLDDCRVIDPDRDDAPGITYEVTNIAKAKTDVYVAREFRFSFRDGVISETGRHSAHEVQGQQSRQLSCDPMPCLIIASQAVPCPPATNLVQFARLTSDAGVPDATCKQALLQAARELAYEAPTRPTFCPI